jgi:hypothetical protein
MRHKDKHHAFHNGNTLRAIPTFRPAALVFGPSATDRLIGDLRWALDSRVGYAEMYAAACAKLGQANRTKLQWRRANQADALRHLNAVRAAVRANAKAIVAARTALLALGMMADAIAAAAPGWEA